MSIGGIVSVTCPDEAFHMAGDDGQHIVLDGINTPGNEIYKELALNKVTLKSVVFNASSDQIVVTLKKGLIELALVLTKGGLGAIRTRTYAVERAELDGVLAILANSFPKQAPLNPCYVKSVMSQSYAKNQFKRRPVDVSLQKLVAYLSWREEVGVPALLAPGEGSRAFDPQLLPHLLEGSIYWYGVDKCGRPILWERFDRFDWKQLDAETKIRFYVLLFEACFLAMPFASDAALAAMHSTPHCAVQSKFCVVAETSGIDYFNALQSPSFFLRAAGLFNDAFPDRLGYFVAKSSGFSSAVMRICKPILPEQLREKVELLADKEFTKRLVEDVLLNGEEDLPDYFGGKKVHEKDIINDFGMMMAKIKTDMADFAKKNKGNF